MSSPRYGQVNHKYGMQLATTAPADDGPVWMVNLMQYRDIADYGDATNGDGRPARSGREADNEYTPLGPLAAVGAEIVYVAEVDGQLLGEGRPWDRVAIVRYPTRKSFIDMQALPEFQAKHVHKEAGMERTIVMGCQPQPLPDYAWGVETVPVVPHPATDTDPELHVMHVIKFSEAGRAEMDKYSSGGAARAAGKHGGGILRWLSVEGTILGDERTWDEVRINTFPSKAAFMAVVADPDRLADQGDHREVAIADTYTLMLRPVQNQLAASFD